MNEEIKQLIEEERRRYDPDTFSFFTEEERVIAKAEFASGANFILHQNRWRKVEEELPTNQDIVLVKTDKGCFATAYLHGKESGFIVYGDDAYRVFGKVIEWKPIE